MIHWSKIFTSIFLSSFLGTLAFLPSKSQATAIAQIESSTGKFVIRAHLIFYGPEATEAIASASTAEISRMWNEPRANFIQRGVVHPVEFRISYDLYVGNAKLMFDASYLRDHPELNLISVQRFDKKNKDRSSFVCGGQTGIFVITDNLGSSTTAAHEFGHGIGLGHVGGTHCVGSRPSIMCMRGATTDPIYQYDPKARRGAKVGGTINPIYRVVRYSDIADLQIPKIPLRADGSKVLGPQKPADCAKIVD